ncbi:hypothetical protein CEUSTIGMA_g10320.t1 [Chlamydomonas eustigma]|uniref:Uncharacterized protein n=1 Tax=Chlamydomonas eustigma TaxID=1157962 RepID=A0A250XIJ4_9CHLO|nr:hypothetical protein CEUSTIGMA_g10320.t1 [Chlamydomonas eustigma]|eukprot:GAX82894.1 hypothetical protein CEUSTIGMA_g10320.t1 [Chlamydomonas eustigma]
MQAGFSISNVEAYKGLIGRQVTCDTIIYKKKGYRRLNFSILEKASASKPCDQREGGDIFDDDDSDDDDRVYGDDSTWHPAAVQPKTCKARGPSSYSNQGYQSPPLKRPDSFSQAQEAIKQQINSATTWRDLQNLMFKSPDAASHLSLSRAKHHLSDKNSQVVNTTYHPQPRVESTLVPQDASAESAFPVSVAGVQVLLVQRLMPNHLVLLLQKLKTVDKEKRYGQYDDSDFLEFVDQVAWAVADQLHAFLPASLPSVLSCFAHLGYHPGDAWAQKILGALSPALEASSNHVFAVKPDSLGSNEEAQELGWSRRKGWKKRIDAIGMSQLLWALGKLNHKADHGWFRSHVLPALQSRVAAMNAQGISNSLWGLATMRIRPEPSLMNMLVEAAGKVATTKGAGADQTADVHPQSLANTLWALAKLDVDPGDEWMESYLLRCLKSLPSFWPKDLTHVAWALAKMGRPLPPNLCEALMLRARRTLDEFTAQELSSIIWALASGGHTPSADWLNAWCDTAIPRLKKFNAQELACSLWSLARMKMEINSTFIGAFFYHSFPKLCLFSSQDFSMTLWALGTLKLFPPTEWLDAYQEESFSQMPYFAPQEYANIVWAYARLSHWPTEIWMDRFFLETRPKLLSFKAQELSQLMYAFAVKNMRPPRQWLNKLLLAAYSKMLYFGPKELSHVMWALSRLRFSPNEVFMTAASCQIQSFPVSSFNNADVDLLQKAFVRFRFPIPAVILELSNNGHAGLHLPQQLGPNEEVQSGGVTGNRENGHAAFTNRQGRIQSKWSAPMKDTVGHHDSPEDLHLSPSPSESHHNYHEADKSCKPPLSEDSKISQSSSSPEPPTSSGDKSAWKGRKGRTVFMDLMPGPNPKEVQLDLRANSVDQRRSELSTGNRSSGSIPPALKRVQCLKPAQVRKGADTSQSDVFEGHMHTVGAAIKARKLSLKKNIGEFEQYCAEPE